MTDKTAPAQAPVACSRQIYIADDILPECVAVNKRVPLTVCGVDDSNRSAVLKRLADLYGGQTEAVARLGDRAESGKLDEIALSFETVELPAVKLTERGRFDFSDLREIMARLRGEGGCEWDRAQTHDSIRINLIEEAYELVEAIDLADRAMMLEESGDVLLQAVFHTQIADEAGEFGYGDMLSALCRKLLDRHTHIFGDNHADNADQALNFWNEAKKKEKKYKSLTDAMGRVPKNLPALLYAEKVQKVAKKGGFDWADAAPAAEKVKEELCEFMSADKAHLAEEGGDLLFAAVNALRLKKVEAEMALRAASEKFCRRFAAVESAVSASGKEMTDCTLEELDAIWNIVKEAE